MTSFDLRRVSVQDNAGGRAFDERGLADLFMLPSGAAGRDDQDGFVTRELVEADGDHELRQIESVHARRVMEATSEGVLILTPEGRCEYANPAAERLLGWPRSVLAGRDVHSVIHVVDDHDCVFDKPFLDALDVQEVTDLWHTNRGRLPVTVSISPSITAGNVDSVVCLFSDATQRLRREQEREALMDAQRAAVERLEDLAAQQKDFVSTVSHELRTPLTSILGYLELVLEGQVPDDTREYLSVVDRNAKRLLAQVNDLLLVSRIESGKIIATISDVDLKAVIKDAVTTLTPQSEKKDIRLLVEVPEEAKVMVRGDSDQLDRVLMNLLSNAIKFTPNGGEVAVSLAVAGNWVQVQVEDSGMGIPAGEQHRLFDKFFRSSISQKKATPGTGLGLAIVKAIIEEHGGKIGIDSEEGVGTAVAFTLPYSESSASNP